jgi:hypothetical protein
MDSAHVCVIFLLIEAGLAVGAHRPAEKGLGSHRESGECEMSRVNGLELFDALLGEKVGEMLY